MWLTERDDMEVPLLPLTNFKRLESCTWVTWRMGELMVNMKDVGAEENYTGREHRKEEEKVI